MSCLNFFATISGRKKRHSLKQERSLTNIEFILKQPFKDRSSFSVVVFWRQPFALTRIDSVEAMSEALSAKQPFHALCCFSFSFYFRALDGFGRSQLPSCSKNNETWLIPSPLPMRIFFDFLNMNLFLKNVDILTLLPIAVLIYALS